MKTLHKIIAAASIALSAASANATVYGSSFFVGATGSVFATFEGSDAGYTNKLYYSTDFSNWSYLFNNHSTPVGTTVSLGNFTAGQELFFKIFVTNTGDTFYSGAASRNFDGVVHSSSNSVGNKTFVGFEDLRGGGDRDYNDVKYSFTNLATQPVPEPETYAMLGLGLALVGVATRRRIK